MRIDHVIVAAADLDAAAARLEAEHGLSAAGGGRHEGLGTHNRIVPLGGGYLEILAVADAEEAARSQLGRALAARIAQAGEGLMAWAVVVDDVVPVAERLGTTVSTIARQGLSARLTGLVEAMAAPFLPFFIARDPGIEDPGGSGDAGGIEWIEVAGDFDRLDAWLSGARLPVRVVDGASAVCAVAISGRILRQRAPVVAPYVTNSLYSTWDNQFYPGLRSWLMRINCAPGGGREIDPDFFVEFHDRPGGPARAHEVRLQGGDCTTEIFQ